MTRAEFAAYLRARADLLVCDDTSASADRVAIYTLSDPRDVRDVRYVGQTRSPRTRYLQHVNKARLWLPDELPWWIIRPQERPLYEWIRELHSDGARLPAMVVTAWHPDTPAARVAERALIMSFLERDHLLLNVEAQIRSRRS